MIADCLQRLAVSLNWREAVDRHLDIDNWFGGEAGNRCRPVVIDTQRERAESFADAAGLGFELRHPGWVMRNDLKFLIHSVTY